MASALLKGLSTNININVNQIVGFKKIGEFSLNNNMSKTLWNFNCIDNTDKKGSHVYIIALNDIIKKIGASVVKPANAAGYRVGNDGKPSDRTTGIHYYIARELYKGNNVSFWIQMCPKMTIECIDLFGNPIIISAAYADPKIIENHHVKSFVDTFKCYPEWNMQEQGRKADWESTIIKINISINKKEIIPYSAEDVKDDILMRLYHWKHNHIALLPITTLEASTQ